MERPRLLGHPRSGGVGRPLPGASTSCGPRDPAGKGGTKGSVQAPKHLWGTGGLLGGSCQRGGLVTIHPSADSGLRVLMKENVSVSANIKFSKTCISQFLPSPI